MDFIECPAAGTSGVTQKGAVMRSMSVRAVRAVTGVLLILLSYPLVLASGALWLMDRHRGADGTYTAVTQPVHLDGYALVVDDIDLLLRSDLPFARGGRTTVRVSAEGGGGPLFLGLAPRAATTRYLAGVAHSRIDRVRVARGEWPLDTTPYSGTAAPDGIPFGQVFWTASATGLVRDGRTEDPLTWSPSQVRGQRLSLVIMKADATAGAGGAGSAVGWDVRLTVALRPEWMSPMVWGLLSVGSLLLALALMLLIWSGTARRVVYVLDDARLSALVERLRTVAPARAEGSIGGPTDGSVGGSVGGSAEASMGQPTEGPGTPPSGPAGRDVVRVSGVRQRPPGARPEPGTGESASQETRPRPRVPAAEAAPAGAARDGGPGIAGEVLASEPVAGPPAPRTSARTAPGPGGVEAPTWAAVLASARPPATPRLLWPPRVSERAIPRPAALTGGTPSGVGGGDTSGPAAGGRGAEGTVENGQTGFLEAVLSSEDEGARSHADCRD